MARAPARCLLGHPAVCPRPPRSEGSLFSERDGSGWDLGRRRRNQSDGDEEPGEVRRALGTREAERGIAGWGCGGRVAAEGLLTWRRRTPCGVGIDLLG